MTKLDFSQTKTPKRLAVLVLVLILVLLTIIGWNFYNRWSDKSLVGNNGFKLFNNYVKTEDKVEEPLTGEKIDESRANKTPIAIVIENHPDARPQIGLNEASVVYEAIAEGGITRFLAFFAQNEPEKVGYVRSARTFFVHWAKEYNAPLTHVGGNVDALDLIKQTDARDLDQFRYGLQAFRREPHDNAATEHTMVAFLPKLREIAKEKNYNGGAKYDKFIFKQDAATETRPQSQTIVIDFSTPTYTAKWTYRPETNDYTRLSAGTQIITKNIIIQEVKRQSVISRNGVGRFEFTLTGSGKAKIVRDGTVIDATWKKSGTARTRFYDSSGAEVQFNRGVTWYEIIHPEITVTIK